MTRRRLPRPSRPARYRMEALPGLEGVEALQWSPQAGFPADAPQGWLPFSDGGQLGPLFNTNHTTTDR